MAIVMSDSGLFSTLTIRELASAKPMLGNPVTLMNTGGLSKMLTMIIRLMPLSLLHVANLILACFICISSVWIFGGLLWAEGESSTPDYFWPTLIALGLPLYAASSLLSLICVYRKLSIPFVILLGVVMVFYPWASLIPLRFIGIQRLWWHPVGSLLGLAWILICRQGCRWPLFESYRKE